MTFQLALHRYRIFDGVYRRWPGSQARAQLVIRVVGSMGMVLHGIIEVPDSTTLGIAEPFAVCMLPWLLPAAEATASGTMDSGTWCNSGSMRV